MKLVDADKIMEAIEIRMKAKENDFGTVSELKTISRYIAQLSPDYDVDKVVKSLSCEGCEGCILTDCCNGLFYITFMEKIREVVRNGGA